MRYLALLASLVLCIPAHAGHCLIRPRVVATSTYVAPQKVVVEQQQVIVKKEYVPLLVYQPVYTGSYTPPVSQEAEALKRKLEEQHLKILELELRLKYEGRGGNNSSGTPTPPTEAPSDPFNPPRTQPKNEEAALGLRTLQNRCAQCHDRSKLTQGAKLGGDLEILRDGVLLDLPCSTLHKIGQVVYNGTMPKRGSGPPLTPEEVGGIMVLMVSTEPRN